jgi:hypothetical protein
MPGRTQIMGREAVVAESWTRTFNLIDSRALS